MVVGLLMMKLLYHHVTDRQTDGQDHTALSRSDTR